MAVFVKFDASLQSQADKIHAKPASGLHAARGSEIFLWSSEDEGGEGLCGWGIVSGSENLEHPNKRTEGTHTRLLVSFVKSRVPVAHPLRSADLAPHRDCICGTPICGLAADFYAHSLNRFMEFTDESTALFFCARVSLFK